MLKTARRVLLPLCLLVAAVVPAAEASEGEPGTTTTVAVRLAPETAGLAGDLERWLWFFQHRPELELRMGEEVTGDVTVEALLLPARDVAGLAPRLAGLPVELVDDGFVFGGTRYGAEYGLALRLPREPSTRWVVLARDSSALLRLVADVVIAAVGLGRRDPPSDYLVWEHRYSQRRGLWQEDGESFRPDPGERDDPAQREATYASLASIRRPGVLLRVPPGRAAEARWAELADALDGAAREMAPRVPVALDEPVEVIVEEDYVALGRHLGELDESLVDGAGRLHLVYHPDDLFAYRHGLARVLLRRAGLAPPPWIEDGAALYLSGGWYGRPHAAWLPDLVAGDVLPAAAELLAGERPPDGSEVLWPVAAAGVVERLPGDTLAAKLAPGLASAAVSRILGRLAAEARTRDGGRPSAGAPGPSRSGRRFHRGVSLAMGGGAFESGYHAPAIDGKLAYLRGMGADSVSIMPLAMKRDPKGPDLRFAIRNPGDETDAGLVHAARRARELDFTVLWKPQIYVGGSWPGEIEMSSEADWEAWWRVYRRFVVHHAVLAEWTGCEIFAVGVELGKTVSREAEWRRLIAAARRIFRGELTYAANWWGDYDRAPFWDALDVVGVDAYFSLAESAEAGPDELRAGARATVARLAAAAEEHGKPVSLTEVGFAARTGAWVSPHEEGGEYSSEHQRLAYEVFLEALGRPGWLHGLYLWKAFSGPATFAGIESPDFGFTGRLAEREIRSYFSDDARLSAQ